MRTSVSHPLQIAAIGVPGGGRIGVTFCPGKVQPGAMTGGWARDLGVDLDAVAAWGAAALVTLVEDHELAALQVTRIGAEVEARHMDWLAVLGDQCEPVSTKMAAYENTRRTPSDFLTF